MAFLLFFTLSFLNAATYNLSLGQYPSCSTSWSVSGTTYTCTGDGKVTLSSGDIVIANTDANIVAAKGYSISRATIGNSTHLINLASDYGKIDIDGVSTQIYGSVVASSANIDIKDANITGSLYTGGKIDLSDSYVGGDANSTSNKITASSTVFYGDVYAGSNKIDFEDCMVYGDVYAGGNTITADNTIFYGDLTASGNNIKLTGGSVAGKLYANDLDTEDTDLLGGATINFGISIDGGELKGDFVGNGWSTTIRNATMESGSISSVGDVTIRNSDIGDSSTLISIHASGNRIYVRDGSLVYGNLTLTQSYACVSIDNSSAVMGSCPTICSGSQNVCTAYSTGPAIHYTFSDCTPGNSVTNITDISGNNNHATAYNNPKCIDLGMGIRGLRFNTDTAGTAYELHSQYARTNNKFSFTYTQGYTVFARFRYNWSPNRIWALYFGMGSGDTCSNNGAHWLINTRSEGDCGRLGKGVTQFGPFCGVQNQFNLYSPTDFEHQDITLASVYYSDTNQMKTYLNGVLVDSDSSATDPVSGNDYVYIARPWSNCSGDSYFSGTYQELRIYPRSLDESEILALFAPFVNASDNGHPSATSYTDSRIYTKVAGTGKEFNISVASLNQDYTGLKPFDGTDLQARVVQESTCPYGDVDELASAWVQIEDLNVTNPQLVFFNIDKAIQKAKIQFKWKVSGADKAGCSYDTFSVKPEKFNINIDAIPPYKSGEHYEDEMNIEVVDGYSQTYPQSGIEINATDINGSLASEFNISNFTAANGEKADFNYSDVGNLIVQYSDSVWTSEDVRGTECIENNCSDTPVSDSDRRVGCNVCGASNYFEVIPYEFNITTVNLANGFDNAYTYVSNNASVSGATIQSFLVQAVNKQGALTEGYNGSAYAKDTNVSFEVNDTVTTLPLVLPSDFNITLFANMFAGGEATVNDRNFSFEHNSSKPEIPFVVNVSDVNITARNTDGVEGNKSALDSGGATFYYGRLNPLDVYATVSPTNGTMYYEVYCDPSVTAGCAGIGAQSPSSALWWINGNQNTEIFATDDTKVSDYTCNNGGNPAAGIVTYTINSNGNTGKKMANVELNNSLQFLYYNKYSDSNITHYYIDFETAPNKAVSDPDVVNNEGRNSKSIKRY